MWIQTPGKIARRHLRSPPCTMCATRERVDPPLNSLVWPRQIRNHSLLPVAFLRPLDYPQTDEMLVNCIVATRHRCRSNPNRRLHCTTISTRCPWFSGLVLVHNVDHRESRGIIGQHCTQLCGQLTNIENITTLSFSMSSSTQHQTPPPREIAADPPHLAQCLSTYAGTGKAQGTRTSFEMTKRP
ncbi:hypothetical protein BDV96DRAFT_384429 [Lophiotrema nucula]|uniref:Uncharacterized protein n=1 Tax=Lophiotrema nucula TaxID=690887 RepID=A0A6A5ZFV8_9PLEO|nr:hypothetical protein BDV96DRAFT_384429 [Lophiotrema nucula]